MRPWLCAALAGACFGTAQAQGRAEGIAPLAQVAEKPAPSRYYGTARPPGPQAAPPPFAAPARPGVQVVPRPPVGYVPGYGGGPRPPVVVVPPPRPRVGVVIGTPGYYPGPYYGRPYPYPYPYPSYPYPYGRPGWGWGYPYPGVVFAPPVVVSPPPPPTVYIERPVENEPPAAGYWYWCSEPQGWYPAVPACSAGWQPVPPRAAN